MHVFGFIALSCVYLAIILFIYPHIYLHTSCFFLLLSLSLISSAFLTHFIFPITLIHFFLFLITILYFMLLLLLLFLSHIFLLLPIPCYLSIDTFTAIYFLLFLTRFCLFSLPYSIIFFVSLIHCLVLLFLIFFS